MNMGVYKHIQKLLGILLMQICLMHSFAQMPAYKNIWTHAPENIPYENSTDAPLLGNGDITMSVGYVPGRLRYYLGKNDFWRLQSQFDKLSGPRVAGFLDITVDEISRPDFKAEQNISDGSTTCILYKNSLKSKSWVSATDNLIFIELEAGKNPIDISIHLSAPYHHRAKLESGGDKNIYWLTRAFSEEVDIPTEVAIGMKIFNRSGNRFVLEANQKTLLVLSIDSKFKTLHPLESVQKNVNLSRKFKCPFCLKNMNNGGKNIGVNQILQ